MKYWYDLLQNKLSILSEKKPLILNITNFVTAEWCANVLLAAGASPVMSQHYKDAVGLLDYAKALIIIS